MGRLLFVHAHPDDETLATGVAIADALHRGHDVDLITATLGDEGEVIPPGLSHLVAARDDTIWAHRRGELSTAMAALAGAAREGAVLRHTVLGDQAWSMPGVPATLAPARWRDSGMAGTPSAEHPRAWVRADLGEAAEAMAAIIADSQPDLVVSYDPDGGYGHPDHIRTREVLLAALRRLPERDRPQRRFDIVTPLSWARQDREWLAQHVPAGAGLHIPSTTEPYAVSVVLDHAVTHVVEAPDLVADQAAGLRAHATQVTVFDGYYTLSNNIAARLSGREGFAERGVVTDELIGCGKPWQAGLFD
ncbi:MAG TPA: PIG-L family deacetylase [Dermatophilaceae bacterium]|nr:PIG-L family deacetylase [Actinomycetales bacterium]HMT31529.1 PIG-L family deacetylase [Dermatophilaceae bacterium]HMT89010.1 PIG-L family deacetylase [Dermatophilaceae bacterium]